MAPPIGVLGCLWRTRELAFLQNNQSGVRAVRNRLGMRHISEASQYCILDRTPRIANWIVYNRTASVPLTVNATGRCIPPNNHPPIAGTCIKYDYAKKLKPRREHGRKCRMVCAKKIQ